MSKAQKWLLGILLLTIALILLAILQAPDDKVHIIACDVGQGDGILITHKSTQIIIDGGPNNKIVDCLSRHGPFWDRKIEIVILTHPQKDHFFGLTEVFNRYYIEHYFSPIQPGEGEEYAQLTEAVEAEKTNIKKLLAGMEVKTQAGEFKFIWPPKEAVETQAFGKDPNFYSAVLNFHYGSFDALFTGDIVPEVSDDILATGNLADIEYLKVPHHGSRNGLTSEILDAVTPEFAVISSGNRYGHPHQEVLDMLTSKNVRTLRTDQLGDVEVITDGIAWWYNQ